MTRGGTLVERATRRLETGPAHTLDLAREALGLNGPSGALSAAVFTLLGGDARFSVDEDGVWTLSPRPASPDLSEVSFAVVDLETTGGAWRNGHRIIEVAVVEVGRGLVGGVWTTLVNPVRSVPLSVQLLTGITEAMVQGAPCFDHVASELSERLEGRVFVAHNAAYDWRFVSEGLLEFLGRAPAVPRLCTLKLARRLLPFLRRRNLDVLSRHYGIPNHARHRADGDALATARVLVRLLEEARGRGVSDLDGLERFLRGSPGRRRGRRGRDGGGRTASSGPVSR